MQDNYHTIENCRACGSKDLTSYLDLGKMPLVNNVLSPETISSEKKFPLEVLFCEDCHLSQLSVVVDPSVLFRHYVYRSSVSDSFAKHCDGLASQFNEMGLLNRNSLVLDIASNDGCLLRQFKNKGNKVLGVDPACNLAEIANASGIKTLPEFWNPELAKKILTQYGPADLITAFNVFAHVDDVHSFVEGANTLLSPNGTFVIESPNMKNLLQRSAFDTIYHEHLSYLSANPVKRVAESHGLRLDRIEEQNIHGGSLRFWIRKSSSPDISDGSVQRVLNEESQFGLYHLENYFNLGERVRGIKANLTTLLRELKSLGKSISCFGASAKGNVLLNYCGLGRETIDAIYDDTPEKQGKLYPGVHVPIVSRENLLGPKKPDYLVLLAWNFAEEMMRKTQDYKNAGGKYILPVPNLEVI